MKEISLILKSNLLVSTEEFKILDRYSYAGRFWKLIQRPTPTAPYIIRDRTVEYIFDPEDLTVFRIVSRNILATWQTDVTKLLQPGEEFQITDSLFIEPIPVDRSNTIR